MVNNCCVVGCTNYVGKKKKLSKNMSTDLIPKFYAVFKSILKSAEN